MTLPHQTVGGCECCGFGPTWVTPIMVTRGTAGGFGPIMVTRDTADVGMQHVEISVCKLCLQTGVAQLIQFSDGLDPVVSLQKQINHVANVIVAVIELSTTQQVQRGPSACATCGHPRQAHDAIDGVCRTAMPGAPGGICQCEHFSEPA